MDGSIVVLLLPENLREGGKTHCIVRICYRKPLGLPKETPGRRNERLAKNDRPDGHCSQQPMLVVQRFGLLTDRARIKCLEVVGVLSIAIQPLHKLLDRYSKLSFYIFHHNITSFET